MLTVVTYRGHIRNRLSLCAELRVDDGPNRDETERALIAAAVQKWGDDAGLHLYGMFACALYDEETDETILLRDPFGTKTMYYYQTADGALLYGTTIEELSQSKGFTKRLNERALQLYLTLTYPAGEETFFEGVKKLAPGHVLRFRDKKITIARYFRPTFSPEENRTLDDFANELHETVKTIMDELESDGVDAGSFLSGGVDSSYVLAMSKARRAYGCGYDDERLDESRLAEQTARLLKRDFIRRLVQPKEYFDAVPYVMQHMEQPLGDASAIAFALGCLAVAEDRKGTSAPVVYSGEGSDEFFGGYNMYRNAARYGENLKTFYVGNTNIMKEEEKRALLLRYDDAVLPIDLARDIYDEDKGLDALTQMSDVDIRLWLEGDIYLNVDKMSLAAGIEVRMPLTDLRVFDIASRVPSRFKVDDTDNKLVVRRAAAKVLPDEIAYRKKLGFVVPIRYWLADPRYNQDVMRTLHGERAAQFFKPDEVQKLTDAYLGGDSDLWRKVWTLYTFLAWHGLNFD